MRVRVCAHAPCKPHPDHCIMLQCSVHSPITNWNMNFKKINLHFKIIFIPPDLTFFSPTKLKKKILKWKLMWCVKTHRWHLFHFNHHADDQLWNLGNLAAWIFGFDTSSASPPPCCIFITQLRWWPYWMEVMARRKNTEGGGWDVESIITQVPNSTWSCFRPSFKLKR